ncbi:MAG TPA: uracil-DNA glycosylase family protein [Pyrinomonadaceae bacterium]|nr:uracil-DNA glycosylase family protein [Pyrinomonadaceae bacterium]
MSETPDVRDALRALIEDVAEQTSYLRELGVEGLEVTLPVAAGESASPNVLSRTSAPERAPLIPPSRGVAPERSPALARHAVADERAKSETGTQTGAKARPSIPSIPKLPPTRSTGARPAGFESSSKSHSEPTEMPKRTTRHSPAPDTPPPQDTLFGEVTPMDAASLPAPGESLEDIRADIGECIRCPLSQSRTHVVHSEGSLKARLMFVGEAPGADEDASGRPFVGRAGQLLNKIIEAIGMKRDEVFIGNVNRCRPPQNRTPTLEEAKACKGFLLREIAVVRPEVIVVLGNTAMKNLLDTKEGITKLRGQFQDYRGIKVMPTFHPAYLLRDPSKKRETWDDMKKVRDYLGQSNTRE